MAKRSWPESMRNAALLGLMQPNLETGRTTQSGYELKVRELFESLFRVIMIFFLSVIDSNTCDKIRTIKGPESHVIMQEISTFVILKATSTDSQKKDQQEYFISLRFLHLFGIR